ncbi:hypothetical protein DFH27DRAFT_601600 [Peziza echinospora]|nr:hypothetical protein DFH27DRAFT_601600 [Peziza echinospora]
MLPQLQFMAPFTRGPGGITILLILLLLGLSTATGLASTPHTTVRAELAATPPAPASSTTTTTTSATSTLLPPLHNHDVKNDDPHPGHELQTLTLTPSTHPHLFRFTGRWHKLADIRHGSGSAVRYQATRWGGSAVTVLVPKPARGASVVSRVTVVLRPRGGGVGKEKDPGEEEGEGEAEGTYIFYVSIDGGRDFRYEVPLPGQDAEGERVPVGEMPVTIYLPRSRGGHHHRGRGDHDHQHWRSRERVGPGHGHGHGDRHHMHADDAREVRFTSSTDSDTPFIFDRVIFHHEQEEPELAIENNALKDNTGIDSKDIDYGHHGWEYARRFDQRRVAVEFVGGLYGHGRGAEVEEEGSEEEGDNGHGGGVDAYTRSTQYVFSEFLRLRHWHITPPPPPPLLLPEATSELESNGLEGLEQYFFTEPLEGLGSNISTANTIAGPEPYRFPKLRAAGEEHDTIKPHYIIVDLGGSWKEFLQVQARNDLGSIIKAENIALLQEEYRARLTRFLGEVYSTAVYEGGSGSSGGSSGGDVAERQTQILVITRKPPRMAIGSSILYLLRGAIFDDIDIQDSTRGGRGKGGGHSLGLQFGEWEGEAEGNRVIHEVITGLNRDIESGSGSSFSHFRALVLPAASSTEGGGEELAAWKSKYLGSTVLTREFEYEPVLILEQCTGRSPGSTDTSYELKGVLVLELRRYR